MLRSNTRNAFSLIELSIVLIIIGLLVAVVSGGTKLISNTKNRTIISDFQKYQLAFLSFDFTYDEFPGDMSMMYDFL